MRRSGAVVAAAALAAAVLGVGRAGRAQCSGGSACPPCTQCRVAPASGSNPSVAEMSTLFDRIAAGPQAYGTLGWNFGGRTTIGAGPGWCGTSGRRDTVPVTFPCVLLKAIYLTESSWRQFCSTNQTVISFDCGYGIAQVTSGMRRGETSSYDAARVASSAAYHYCPGPTRSVVLDRSWPDGREAHTADSSMGSAAGIVHKRVGPGEAWCSGWSAGRAERGVLRCGPAAGRRGAEGGKSTHLSPTRRAWHASATLT